MIGQHLVPRSFEALLSRQIYLMSDVQRTTMNHWRLNHFSGSTQIVLDYDGVGNTFISWTVEKVAVMDRTLFREAVKM